MEDPNLKLLAVVHEQQSLAQDMQVALTLAAMAAPDPTIEFSVDTVSSIAALIGAQHKMVAMLLEQNQKVFDRIDNVVRRLEGEAGA